MVGRAAGNGGRAILQGIESSIQIACVCSFTITKGEGECSNARTDTDEVGVFVVVFGFGHGVGLVIIIIRICPVEIVGICLQVGFVVDDLHGDVCLFVLSRFFGCEVGEHLTRGSVLGYAQVLIIIGVPDEIGLAVLGIGDVGFEHGLGCCILVCAELLSGNMRLVGAEDACCSRRADAERLSDGRSGGTVGNVRRVGIDVRQDFCLHAAVVAGRIEVGLKHGDGFGGVEVDVHDGHIIRIAAVSIFEVCPSVQINQGRAVHVQPVGELILLQVPGIIVIICLTKRNVLGNL